MKKIEMWTFEFCPYCVKAKALLDELNVEYTEYMIPFGDSRLKDLEVKTGCDTLPQLFADDEFIGDCSKMIALNDRNELLPLLGV